LEKGRLYNHYRTIVFWEDSTPLLLELAEESDRLPSLFLVRLFRSLSQPFPLSLYLLNKPTSLHLVNRRLKAPPPRPSPPPNSSPPPHLPPLPPPQHLPSPPTRYNPLSMSSDRTGSDGGESVD